MSGNLAKKLAFISGWALLLIATEVRAGNPFGTYHFKPKCPPYCGNCFGFNPTQWRTWPAECTPPVVVAQESAPARMPRADEDKVPKELPEMNEKKKYEPKLPEPEPAPKPSAVRNKPANMAQVTQKEAPSPVNARPSPCLPASTATGPKLEAVDRP
jgi:hypothetical protein